MKTIYLWNGDRAVLIGTNDIRIDDQLLITAYCVMHGKTIVVTGTELKDCQHFIKELLKYWHRGECFDATKYVEQFNNSITLP